MNQQYAIEADPGRLTASFPIYNTPEEIERVLSFAPFYGKPLPRVLVREAGGTKDDWTPVVMCEEGIDVCRGEHTDCCDELRPSCETTSAFDPNGDLLVTTCRSGCGCDTT